MKSIIMIQISRDKITDFCHRWKVTELSVFGSALREDFRPDSDVDLLISFSNNAKWGLFDLADMTEELKAIFSRDVDLVEKKALRNPFRRNSILPNREIIYESG